MKDYHLPIAVTIPAAIGLVGVLWLLRRKNGSSEEGKRFHKAVPEEKDCIVDCSTKTQTEQQTHHFEMDGITISQRKIPETLARDRSSSDLRSLELPELMETVISQVNLVSEKLNGQCDRHLNVDKVQADVFHCGQEDGLKSENISEVGQNNILISSDAILCNQGDRLASSNITEYNHGEMTNIVLIDQGINLTSAAITPYAQDNGLISSVISQNGLTSLDVTELGTSNSLTLPNITQNGQCGSLTSSDFSQDGQCGSLISDVTQDGQCGSLTSSDFSQCGSLTSDVTQDGQCGNLTSSNVTQDCKCISLTSNVNQDGQNDGQTSSDVTQDGQHGSLTADATQDGQCGSLTADAMEYGQGDRLTSSQIVYIEKQIITAMGDGVREAHRKLSKPSCQSQSFKEMSPDLDMPDFSSKAEQLFGSKIGEELLVHKISISELQAAVHTGHTPEIDLNMIILTGDHQSDEITEMKSHPQVKNSFVSLETDTVISEPSWSTSIDKIPENISSGTENLGTLQKMAESSPQEVSASSVQPSSFSSPVDDSVPHVNSHNKGVHDLSPAKFLKQDDQQNQGDSVDIGMSKSAREPFDADTDNTSFKITQDAVCRASSASVSSIKSPSVEHRETRSPASPWLPKASTSSIDSFGPEEIEAIWGIDSSIGNLDTELSFVDPEPVILPLDTNSLMYQTVGLDMNEDVLSPSIMLCDDSTSVTASSRKHSAQGCDNGAVSFSDQGMKDDSLAKSNSPMCDNNSEGSNDSGRGGSEHDMVCQGVEASVQFEFHMPSELCGQFIGKHGKNINYLKSKTGAHVSLSNNPFTPEYQICQIVGTQAEVDDALTMIRRKFPLQDYPLLTMVPINMSVPLPLQPDNQVLFPEVMQLSLPEGVSVEVFVSAVVDAGQVFVQQPTHRSFMSLEKLNYFLNLVYAQDPNVPGMPSPVESGIICVCESEGFWYRAMIMSPEDENGEVQVKFVDYGGYVSLPVSALKQIRADFMSLPFQAVECFMANITPNQNERFFSTDATQALSEMTQGKLLQCQVVARTEYGVPYIHLYQVNSETSSAVLINRALVNRRLVRWIEIL